MSPSRRIISPTSSECPTRTNSYIAAPDIFCAVTTEIYKLYTVSSHSYTIHIHCAIQLVHQTHPQYTKQLNTLVHQTSSVHIHTHTYPEPWELDFKTHTHRQTPETEDTDDHIDSPGPDTA